MLKCDEDGKTEDEKCVNYLLENDQGNDNALSKVS